MVSEFLCVLGKSMFLVPESLYGLYVSGLAIGIHGHYVAIPQLKAMHKTTV